MRKAFKSGDYEQQEISKRQRLNSTLTDEEISQINGFMKSGTLFSSLDSKVYLGPKNQTDELSYEAHASSFNQNDHVSLNLNSATRNKNDYPNAADFSKKLDLAIQFSKTVRPTNINLPPNLYNVNSTNDTLYYSISDDSFFCLFYTVKIPHGKYTITELLGQLQISYKLEKTRFQVYNFAAHAEVGIGSPATMTFSQHSISKQIGVKFNVSTEAAVLTIHAPPVKTGYNNQIKILSVEVSLSQVVNARGTDYTVDVVTIHTDMISNIGDNSVFSLTIIGENGTIKNYSNMSSYWHEAATPTATFQRANVSGRSFNIYLNSADASNRWPFSPRTSENFQTGTVSPIARENNILELLGGTLTATSRDRNKILTWFDNGTYTYITTANPHGQDPATPAANIYIQVGSSIQGPITYINTSTSETYRRIQIDDSAIGGFTPEEIISGGYQLSKNFLYFNGIQTTENPKQYFVRITLNHSIDIGTISLPTTDVTFFATTRYLPNQIIDTVNINGEHIFKSVFPKLSNIRVRLYDESLNLVNLEDGQDWSIDILFSGRQYVSPK